MAYDVEAVPGQYPALADGRAWLDWAAGTQVPQAVIDTVAQTYRTGLSNQEALLNERTRVGAVSFVDCVHHTPHAQDLPPRRWSCRDAGGRGINCWHGHAYGWELTRALEVSEGGAGRAS